MSWPSPPVRQRRDPRRCCCGIGSVYAAKLLQAGHEVVLFARGRRLSDLQAHGLILEDGESGQHTAVSVPSLNELAEDERYDLVVVHVERGRWPRAVLRPMMWRLGIGL